MLNISLKKKINTTVVWDLISNIMYVRYLNIWNKFFFHKKLYVTFYEKNNFLKSKYKILLFFKKKAKSFATLQFFRLFYFLLKLHVNESPIKIGFYKSIDLIGLGFRISKITQNLFYFELGWASGVYFFVPWTLKVVISSKRKRILILGHDVHDVMNMVSSLVLLRRMNPYRIGGFMPQKSIIRLRTGKQR